ALQYYYDKSTPFDPKDSGVVVRETRANVDGKKTCVVKSFDHGKYTLEGHDKTLTHWELLRDRCDGGVTLDDDLRRFIIHLVQKRTIMMDSVVPCISGTSGNVTTG
ncbi:unnamed protein product, partial [Ectocarpus sp. 8 AP-2014]